MTKKIRTYSAVFNFSINHRQLSITGYQMLFATLWQSFMSVDKESSTGYAVLLLSLLSGLSIDSQDRCGLTFIVRLRN